MSSHLVGPRGDTSALTAAWLASLNGGHPCKASKSSKAQSNATAAGLCDLQSVVPDSPGRPGEAFAKSSLFCKASEHVLLPAAGAEPNNLQPGSRRCRRWFSGALRMANREWISLDASKALLDRVLGNERVKRHACFRRRLRLGDWDCEGFPLPDEGASPRRSLCTVKVLFRLRLCVEWSQSFRACSKTWQESLPGYCHWRANEQWPGKWRCQRHLSA